MSANTIYPTFANKLGTAFFRLDPNRVSLPRVLRACSDRMIRQHALARGAALNCVLPQSAARILTVGLICHGHTLSVGLRSRVGTRILTIWGCPLIIEFNVMRLICSGGFARAYFNKNRRDSGN
jgi:hypothetical protein